MAATKREGSVRTAPCFPLAMDRRGDSAWCRRFRAVSHGVCLQETVFVAREDSMRMSVVKKTGFIRIQLVAEPLLRLVNGAAGYRLRTMSG